MSEKMSKELYSDWDYYKNEEVNPDFLLSYSGKSVFWECNICGYKWKDRIASRTNGKGCPECIGRILIKGKNDLLTLLPEIASEWCYESNNILKPENVKPFSHKMVFWKCKKKEHIWSDTIAHRSSGRGCPYCSGKRVIIGKTDLLTLFPNIADNWNMNKNKGMLPQNVTAYSHRKIWWTCSKGHDYEFRISDRTTKNTGCPYCSGHRPIKGTNDLATLRPELISEWDVEKNGDKSPDQFTAQSSYKAWWVCNRGHCWKSTISNRYNGRRCPECFGMGLFNIV